MSNDLVSQQLLVPGIPGNQMAQLESIPSKMEQPMQMGFMGSMTNGSPAQGMSLSDMQMRQIHLMSNGLGSQTVSIPNQKAGQIEPQFYHQVQQQYMLGSNPLGEIGTMSNTVQPQQVSALAKRKAPMEPVQNSLGPHKLSIPNKRVAQIDHRPWLQQNSIPNKRAGQMPLVSNAASVQPPTKKSISAKSGTLISKSQASQMQPSPKGQSETFESVRTKMREQLAAALALVSQQRGDTSTVENKSENEAASSPTTKIQENSQPTGSVSVNADTVGSVSNEPQKALPYSMDGSNNETMCDSTQSLKPDGQKFLSTSIFPDEDVPFSDNFFARDELLQGNGLSWVLEPEIDMDDKKGIQNVEKQKSDNESVETPEVVALKIEVELFKLFGGVNKKYKEKGRSLLFNLKDRSNPELRERVMSGEIPPDRLCSMSAEELASKELSEWRQAKAEELAKMAVLPDNEVDIRRLVKKTHKGEFQVEVDQVDSSSVEVSGGTSLSHLPYTEMRQATDKTVEVKGELNTAAEKCNIEGQDASSAITLQSTEGTDLMQGLMSEDELKDADFLPPIVSLDEFMKSLDSEPPFQNLSGDTGRSTPTSDKDHTEAGSDSKSPNITHQVQSDTDKANAAVARNDRSDVQGQSNDIPVRKDLAASGATLKGDHIWEGTLQLNVTSTASVIGIFKSGEKTSTKEWPDLLEIKGRVRLDAIEKFLQDLRMSRSRAVMVLHFVCKESSPKSEHGSLSEVAGSYVMDGRVGFAEPASKMELYLCPPHEKTLEILSKNLAKDQLHALNAIDNGLIGVVVWRRAQLISPKTDSHHKHSSKKQHFSSRRHQEKDTSNVNAVNSAPKPSLLSRPPPDDDDGDVPPGFGPPASSRDEDDLPEFNFSGGSNPSALQFPNRYPSHLHSQAPRPVDQVRELIQKYGSAQTSAAPVGSIQPWNDDDDDIPEWQPQQPQHLPASLSTQRFQQPIQRPQLLPQQTLPTMPTQVQQSVPQTWQQSPYLGTPAGSFSQPVSGGQYYGSAAGPGQPAWRRDAPKSRGF